MSNSRERTPVRDFDYKRIAQLDQGRIAAGLGLKRAEHQDELKILTKSLEVAWEEIFPNGIDLSSHYTEPFGSVPGNKLASILDDPKRVDIFGSLADRKHPDANIHRTWALAAIKALIQPHNRALKARQTQTPSGGTRHTPRVPVYQQRLPFACLAEVSIRITVEGHSLGYSFPIGHFLNSRSDEKPISALTMVNGKNFWDTIEATIFAAHPEYTQIDLDHYMLMFRTSQPSNGAPKDPVIHPRQLLSLIYQAANCLFEEGMNWRVVPASLMLKESVHARELASSSKRTRPDEHVCDAQHRNSKARKSGPHSSAHSCWEPIQAEGSGHPLMSLEQSRVADTAQHIVSAPHGLGIQESESNQLPSESSLGFGPTWAAPSWNFGL